jgi:hypothetical protein
LKPRHFGGRGGGASVNSQSIKSSPISLELLPTTDPANGQSVWFKTKKSDSIANDSKDSPEMATLDPA